MPIPNGVGITIPPPDVPSACGSKPVIAPTTIISATSNVPFSSSFLLQPDSENLNSSSRSFMAS
jgi:hypothetical protein